MPALMARRLWTLYSFVERPFFRLKQVTLSNLGSKASSKKSFLVIPRPNRVETHSLQGYVLASSHVGDTYLSPLATTSLQNSTPKPKILLQHCSKRVATRNHMSMC